MVDAKATSPLLQIGGIIWFLLMSLGAMCWFALAAIDLFDALKLLPESISFPKGSFYLFGVSVCLGALIVYMIYEVVKKQPPSKVLSKLLTYLAIFGLALVFIVPQLSSYFIEAYLQEKGYIICESASHQWLHSQTIVFVVREDVCLNLKK